MDEHPRFLADASEAALQAGLLNQRDLELFRAAEDL
jgi:hypothetical protein